MAFPEYEGFTVGASFGPVEITVDAHRVRSFVYAVDDFNPWYLYDSPFGGPVAPPSLLTSDDPEFAPLNAVTTDRALAARYELRSLQPIRIDQRVRLYSRNVDQYVRRGKGYVVRDFEVRASRDDAPLTRSRLVEMVGVAPGVDVGTGTSRPPDGERIVPRSPMIPPATRADRQVAIGSPLPALTKIVTRKQMFVFSARPGWWTSIHTDPDFARSLGLPDAIAQGLMTTAYVSQMCVAFFQESWFQTGWLSLAFVRPVPIDDTLHVEGIVTGRTHDADGARLHLEVWCRNQHGELATVGRASAGIDPAGADPRESATAVNQPARQPAR
jgi:acyl dehydratase